MVGILFSFHKYYLTSNYDMIIEMPCNQTIEECEYRPCGNDHTQCGPNNSSHYKKYSIKAYDFKVCPSNTCQMECLTGQIRCTPYQGKL